MEGLGRKMRWHGDGSAGSGYPSGPGLGMGMETESGGTPTLAHFALLLPKVFFPLRECYELWKDTCLCYPHVPRARGRTTHPAASS